MKLYIIRDVLASAAAGPIIALPHDAVAVRMFREIATDRSTTISRFITDHELWCVGEFDGTECSISAPADEYPRTVVTGAAIAAMDSREEPANA